MRGDIEDNMTVFGYALLLIALGFMVTMYFTWQAIKMLHGDDGDDDDDDGED
jgi:predicted peroxiredoxin